MGFRKDTRESFGNVARDVRRILNRIDLVNNRVDRWAEQFRDLRNELATNGVVSKLHKTMKRQDNLERQHAQLLDLVESRFAELSQNGVATAINKLNREVFGKQKQDDSATLGVIYAMAGAEVPADATLAGKVDAIIEHLGIEVAVQPKEVKESKVVAKRKPATKKKGSRR